MITLMQLAENFENGLNDVMKELYNSEIKFKIWSEAGEYRPFIREGNIVTFFINGNLRTSTSANDANNLVMGINGLALDLEVPVQQPRTNSQQNAEELARIKNGQYPFIQSIVGVLNDYFGKAQAKIMYDENGQQFSVAYRAGSAVSGSVDLVPTLGNIMEVSVYIEVYFIAGGVNSKDVIVYFDDSVVPFMAVRHGRTPVVESDVYAGNLVSKNTVTSTAFAIDIDFPMNFDKLTKSSIDYLFKGKPNVAHFVKVVYGELGQHLFLMTLNTLQTSAQGISIAGGSVSLMEVVENAKLINVPKQYQTGRFAMEGSTVAELTFTPSRSCNAFIAGNAYELAGGQLITVPLTAANIDYDEDDGKYYVYLITNGAVNITGSDVSFTIIQEAEEETNG